MRAKRLFAPRSLESAHLKSGRVEPNFVRVLTRLLAAHAIAEKLTACGYERALTNISDQEVRRTAEKNLAEERKHAALVYRLLNELGVSEAVADRSMISALKSPSFEAPRYFADHASGELDLLMGGLALDVTGLLMIGENYRESSYAPHARVADAILEEEADHDAFAADNLRVAAERFGPEPVNAALREWVPRAANFFGPPGSGFTYDCLRYGLKVRDNQDLAGLYLEILERRIEQAGLTMPALSNTYPQKLDSP